VVSFRRSSYLPTTLALGAVLLVPAISQAHFILDSPPASTEQNALGDPQKAPPCGDNGSAVATNVVTSYAAGETITVTIDERIFHPGHYRIALALDDGVFPEEPPVTPGATPCGSAPIDPAPAFPVLADGVFEHTVPFDQPQSIEITLPEDVSCTNCTLQIIQFMSNHALNNPGGCYYHHCAAIAIDADPTGATSTSGKGSDDGTDEDALTTGADGTTGTNPTNGSNGNGSAGDDATAGSATVSDTDPGQTPANSDESGCSCSLPEDGGNRHFGMLLGLLGLMGLRLRARRPAPRRRSRMTRRPRP